jgi:hypothetical protein
MRTEGQTIQDRDVHYLDLLAYLTYKGWHLIDDSSSKFIVFTGPKDEVTNLIEIVFLRLSDAREQPIYIANALDILSTIEGIKPWELANDISNINRDNLRIRMLEIGVGDAIPLKTAAQQIYDLKQLVAYAALSEVDQKPFYVNSQRPEAKNAISAYRFGHTFKGSFGFSIETPKMFEFHNYKQLSLLPELVADKTNVSIWRKVMERIVRGLLLVEAATRQQEPKIIIENYREGLNANMCQALANMLADKRQTLEYSIKWAPLKMPDAPDLQRPHAILLNEPAYYQLEYAANQLLELEPEEVTVKGLVIELSAKDSPMILDTSRVVKIRWHDESEGKTYEATAVLDRDDYKIAIEAHEYWTTVQITGKLKREKQKWSFISYTDFHTMA